MLNINELIEKPTVLIVDDTPDNIVLLSELLKSQYKLKIANNGERALMAASMGKLPDIILLDIMMPLMDGYETCRRLKANVKTRDIPVIFLTAKSTIEDEIMGFDLGAVDYISKPFSPPVVLARVQSQLELKKARDYLKDQKKFLEAEVQRRTQEVVAIQEVTILAMASLAETRDNETGDHIRRTQYYVRALAERLRHYPRFNRLLDDDTTIDILYKSAPLHDIGKVGIQDRILQKPGKLTAEEFKIMKTHTTIGRETILSAEKRLGVELPFLRTAKEIAYSHHEKWDGSGYPLGVAGDEIPVSGRLMAIADVYDALISRRVYKDKFDHETAMQIIADSKGTHFDPDVVDAFVEIADEFLAISQRYSDSDLEMF